MNSWVCSPVAVSRKGRAGAALMLCCDAHGARSLAAPAALGLRVAAPRHRRHVCHALQAESIIKGWIRVRRAALHAFVCIRQHYL